MSLSICIGCKIVIVRDFRGVVTALCLACGAADEVEQGNETKKGAE